MIIYFLIVILNFSLMFKNILESLRNREYNNKLFFLKLFVFERDELKRHKSIHNKYDYKIYKLITYFTLFFLFLSYLYSIIYKFEFNCEDNQENIEIYLNNKNSTDCTLERAEYGKYLISIAYIFGSYNYSDIYELFDSNYLYLIFFIIILVSKYMKMIIYSLEKIISKNREKFNKLNIKIPYLLTINAYLKVSKIRINQNEKNRKIIEKLIKDYENLEKFKGLL